MTSSAFSDEQIDGERARVAATRLDCLTIADERVCRDLYPAPGNPKAFWLLAGVFVLGMAGGSLPSPLYPLYQTAYGLSKAVITLIFACYGAGVLLALVGVGRASDRAGRRPMLLAALGLAVISSVSFLAAQGLAFLMVGRFLSGLAVGVLSGTATATLTELEPSGNRRRASVVSGIATPGGLGLGTLLAGLAIEFGPVPLRLIFATYLGLLILMAAAVLSLPETVAVRTPRNAFGFQRLHVPRYMRTGFFMAASGVFAAFALMSTFAALLPSFLAEALDEPGRLLSGVILALVFGAAAVAPPIIGRRTLRTATVAGLAAVVCGLVLFVAGLAQTMLVLVITGSVIAGFGAGCYFVGTLALVNRDAPPERRAEVVSAYFVAGYLGVTLPPVAVGFASVSIGILTSVIGIAALIVVLAGLTSAGVLRITR